MRNRIILLLILSFLASSAVDFLLSGLRPPTQAETQAYAEVVFGVIVLAYWLRGESEYNRPIRPLGITALAILNFVFGALTVLEGFVLLFAPIYGIISVIVMAFGAGIIYLGKGFWEGHEWRFWITIIPYVIAIMVGIVEIPFRLDNP